MYVYASFLTGQTVPLGDPNGCYGLNFGTFWPNHPNFVDIN